MKGREKARGEERNAKEGEYDLQLFQCRLNVRKFEKYCLVRNLLVVQHETDAPDDRREADVLGAGQVVQNNFGLDLGGHAVVQSDKDAIEGSRCSCRLLPYVNSMEVFS